MICSLCGRQCRALRSETENTGGFCRMPLLPKIAKADLHFWEEPVISGINGSGAVFFSGCPLSCVYCQNYGISHEGYGKTVSYERLAEIFRELERKGAHNINLVNPTHYAPAVIKALDIYRPDIPIVYNTGGYDTVDTLKMLAGYIDIYLTDLKYLNSERSKLYSCAENYPEIAVSGIFEAGRQQPECVIQDGIMKKGVIIRHLILPQGTREAISVFDWVYKNVPGSYFSIMSQYIPFGKAEDMPPINRKITKREYEKVLDHIMQSEYDKVFIQERSSADGRYIPDFDLKGV